MFGRIRKIDNEIVINIKIKKQIRFFTHIHVGMWGILASQNPY
jgi:hypothetical protein